MYCIVQETPSERIAQMRRARDVERMFNSSGRSPSKLEGAAAPKSHRRRHHTPPSERPNPKSCAWYKNYVLDPRSQFRDPTTSAGKLFRRRFRVTWHTYQEMVADANACPDFARWHDGTCDVFGTPCTPLVRFAFIVCLYAPTRRAQNIFLCVPHSSQSTPGTPCSGSSPNSWSWRCI